MSVTMNASVRDTALEIVQGNVEEDAALERVYLFPADDEIRLIYVDRTASPFHDGERLAPFYFGANRPGGPPYLSAVAVIRPEDEKKVPLPEGWGEWSDGEVVWEQSPSG